MNTTMRKLLLPAATFVALGMAGATAPQAQDAGGMDTGKMMEGAARMMQEGMKMMQQGKMPAMPSMPQMSAGGAPGQDASSGQKPGVKPGATSPARSVGKQDKAAQSAAAQDDPRTFVELPPEIRTRFLATMRGFMETLDAISAALAEGNFAEAATIAEDRMGPAHEMMKKLQKMQATPEQIAEIKKRARARFAEVVAESGDQVRPMLGRIVMQVLGKPLPGMAQHRRTAIGPHLPADMHRMGIQLHLNAADFADTARKVGKTPTVEDYRKVLSAYNQMTSMCVACHNAWRVF